MSNPKIQINDVDLSNVETALQRAAAKARKIAEDTHTPLIVHEGGRVVKKFLSKKKTNESD